MTAKLNKTSPIAKEYGIQGYIVAKTCNYLARESKFPKAKRKDLTYEAQCHLKEPDPTKYSDPYEQTVKRYWIKPNGKFFKAKKETLMDEVMKRAKNSPGPGAYHKDNKQSPKHTKGSFR